jgi:hypothetical protein
MKTATRNALRMWREYKRMQQGTIWRDDCGVHLSDESWSPLSLRIAGIFGEGPIYTGKLYWLKSKSGWY